MACIKNYWSPDDPVSKLFDHWSRKSKGEEKRKVKEGLLTLSDNPSFNLSPSDELMTT